VYHPLRLTTLCAALAAGLAAPAAAQTIQTPFADSYAFTSLGAPQGVPPFFGGITFLDFDTLLIGGSANTLAGAIYSVDVTRDANNHVTGFAGPATFFAAAPGVAGGIDGGLQFHPGSDVLFYTSYADNYLGQIRPGSTAPDSLIDLSAFGVTGSVGTLAFVPTGFAGAGDFIVASYLTSDWYRVGIDFNAGTGTYDVTGASLIGNFPGGPEGIIFVEAGNDDFAVDSVLVSEYASGRISAYELDASGNPVLATRRDFMTGLGGAEGAAFDPFSGDFLFSTFGGNDRVIVVQGLQATEVPVATPEPETLLLFALACLGVGLRRRLV